MKILFLCIQNSAGSQMAEALARSMFPPSIEVMSAGSKPSFVNPYAVRAMREAGIDISTHFSKSVADIDTSNIDLAVTLCAEEVCPATLGKVRRIQWPLPDPAQFSASDDQVISRFRLTRDELRTRLATLLATLQGKQ